MAPTFLEGDRTILAPHFRGGGKKVRARWETLARKKEEKNARTRFRKWSAYAHRYGSIREENGPYADFASKSPLWALVSNNGPHSKGRGPHTMGKRSVRTKKVRTRSAHD